MTKTKIWEEFLRAESEKVPNTTTRLMMTQTSTFQQVKRGKYMLSDFPEINIASKVQRVAA